MIRIALKMLMGDRAKYAGLVLGVAFTSFLVAFAASYFCGIMTRGFSLVAENSGVDVWVMDPAVASAEQTINMPSWVLERVRSVQGVRSAMPMALAGVEARFPDGGFQPVQLIGVDDGTLAGAPSPLPGRTRAVLRSPDAAILDPGGTSGKLETARAGPARRPLVPGDELLVNDHRVQVAGLSETLPRFPPRPLLFMTFSNAVRILSPERSRLTFVLAEAEPGVAPRELAARIGSSTGLRARASEDFKADTVRWYLANSEDVGDIAAMLSIAGCVGFGATGVLLFMFTADNVRHYAVLSAMGASRRLLLAMIFAQAGLCGLVGTGVGIGLCAGIGSLASARGYPFRMMWFTPVLGGGAVVLVCLVAAALSVRPVLRLQPAVVFAGR